MVEIGALACQDIGRLFPRSQRTTPSVAAWTVFVMGTFWSAEKFISSGVTGLLPPAEMTLMQVPPFIEQLMRRSWAAGAASGSLSGSNKQLAAADQLAPTQHL